MNINQLTIKAFTDTTSTATHALVPYDRTGPSTDVLNIMKRVVEPNSTIKYNNENIRFLLWIYDHDEEESIRYLLLEDWFIIHLDWASTQDNGNKSRTVMRKICRSAIEAIHKGSNNCPIILASLEFNVFSHYLTTRKKEDGTYLSKSAYNGIRSSLQHLYRMSGQVMSAEMTKDLAHFMAGLKRTITSEKVQRGETLDEGKRIMTFEVYNKMCEIMYKGEDDEFLFAHTFLTLEWNLMARSENCVNMNINNVQFQDDALIFYFGKSKRNPYGLNSHKPWHVYSNPFAPHICPVLALAKYALSHPDILQDDCPLFPGKSQYDRFLKIFYKVINENEEEFGKLGVKKGDLGAHSPRKGTITLVASGCTVSPPMSSICIRACWSMGPVKDRYIHCEKAGDEFVGRTATGISSMVKEFAVSPFFF